MATIKITEIQTLEAIITALEGGEVEIGTEDMVAYCEKRISQIEAKAMKAKERAAAKKTEGDELRATIGGLLTTELQTGEEITAALDDPEVTKAKVVARLGQLVAAGVAIKEQIKDGDRKVMAYRLAAEDAVAAE